MRPPSDLLQSAQNSASAILARMSMPRLHARLKQPIKKIVAGAADVKSDSERCGVRWKVSPFDPELMQAWQHLADRTLQGPRTEVEVGRRAPEAGLVRGDAAADCGAVIASG